MKLTFPLIALLCNVHASELPAYASIQPHVGNPLGANISGSVELRHKKETPFFIEIRIHGLIPGSIHGLHIHEKQVPGNIQGANNNCTAAGGHWNPLNGTHGAPTNDSQKRHMGDLGNFKADDKGSIIANFTDSLLSFYGEYALKDRAHSFVVHEKQDDLGLGNNTDSLKTGNAGSRLGCGNINFSEPVYSSASGLVGLPVAAIIAFSIMF